MTECYEATVVVVAFRRPSLAQLQLKALAVARPKRLLVACDVPPSRERAHAERIQAAFHDGVSWPCDLRFDVASQHLGLNRRVTTAIDLALEMSDTAIILEDDCVPHPDFFSFATCLLGRYRSDHRVQMIAGGRPRNAPRWGETSYYFSRYPFIWGWATWADRWQGTMFDPRSWNTTDDDLLRSHFADEELDYWRRMTSKSIEGRGSWDYQWFLEMLRKDGLCAVPNVNLVRNVGFGRGATHTTAADDFITRSVPLTRMDPSITHPEVVDRHTASDVQAFREVFLRDASVSSRGTGVSC